MRERSDWFEHGATRGVKPLFLCEYGLPLSWNWTMYRGWYRGRRTFGGAKVPWEFCLAEWNAQFLGDRAFRISGMEKANLRWEAAQARAGRLWHRRDYPYRVGSNPRRFPGRQAVWAAYITENRRAYRTWGVSGISPWNHGVLFRVREGVDRSRKDLEVDWDALQRPGFSPDYVDERYERMDLAFERSDWTPTVAGRALIRHNRPLLAYLGGRPGRFTARDHDYLPGETVEKQLIVINNSRETVTADCSWSLALPRALSGRKKVTVATGEQVRIPLRFALPPGLAPGTYELTARVAFRGAESHGAEARDDRFPIQVLPEPPALETSARIALFDPRRPGDSWTASTSASRTWAGTTTSPASTCSSSGREPSPPAGRPPTSGGCATG